MEITTPEQVQKRSAYQGIEEARPPPWAGIDRDPARRPGRLRVGEPKPLPNTSYPPERQANEPAVPKHNRPNKPFPPVFGTSTPLKGLSGAVRRLAYALPDHKPEHWLVMMLGDRIESWGVRAQRLLPVAVPVIALVLLTKKR
jgi:hypothetical protein